MPRKTGTETKKKKQKHRRSWLELLLEKARMAVDGSTAWVDGRDLLIGGQGDTTSGCWSAAVILGPDGCSSSTDGDECAAAGRKQKQNVGRAERCVCWEAPYSARHGSLRPVYWRCCCAAGTHALAQAREVLADATAVEGEGQKAGSGGWTCRPPASVAPASPAPRIHRQAKRRKTAEQSRNG